MKYVHSGGLGLLTTSHRMEKENGSKMIYA